MPAHQIQGHIQRKKKQKRYVNKISRKLNKNILSNYDNIQNEFISNPEEDFFDYSNKKIGAGKKMFYRHHWKSEFYQAHSDFNKRKYFKIQYGYERDEKYNYVCAI